MTTEELIEALRDEPASHVLCLHAANRLEALSRARPIDEDTPRNEEILLWEHDGWVVGRWGAGEYNRSTRSYDRGWTDGPNVLHPTHWLPLPEPPRASPRARVGR